MADTGRIDDMNEPLLQKDATYYYYYYHYYYYYYYHYYYYHCYYHYYYYYYYYYCCCYYYYYNSPGKKNLSTCLLHFPIESRLSHFLHLSPPVLLPTNVSPFPPGSKSKGDGLHESFHHL